MATEKSGTTLGIGEYKTIADAERELTNRQDVILTRDGNGVLLNFDLTLSHRFFRPTLDHRLPVNTLLVGKEMSVPLKFRNSSFDRIIPDLSKIGQFGVLFAYLDHPNDFFVGDRYRIVFNEISEEDRANGIIKLALYTRDPIESSIEIPGNINFTKILQLVRRLQIEQGII
jgi:hypothetical protein